MPPFLDGIDTDVIETGEFAYWEELTGLDLLPLESVSAILK